MKYAAQLHLPVETPFLKKAKVVIGQHVIQSHGVHRDGYNKPRAVRRYLPRKQTELVREQLPPEIQHSLIAVNLTEIRLLAPHIHLDEQAVINFYLEANGEKTSFWEGEIIPDEESVVDHGNSYWNLRRDALTEIEYFVAKPGDVWVMNTRQPHSVSYADDTRDAGLHFEPLDNTCRLIMQAFMSTPYDEIVFSMRHKIVC